MAFEIRVPEVSEGTVEGVVVALNVKVGERVAAEQSLFELETDKAVVTIPAPRAGTISEIRVSEGDEVAVGAVIMLMDEAGEPSAEKPAPVEKRPDVQEPTTQEDGADQEPVAKAPPGQATAPATETKPAPQRPAAAEQQKPATPATGGDKIAPASPSVRRQARELGVDIHRVPGSGPGGRIDGEDVRRYVRDAMQSAGGTPAGVAQRPLPDFSRWGEVKREPLSRLRELTAEAMSYAWSTIPMVTQYDRARIGAIEQHRKDFNAQVDAADKLTMTAILAKACAAALQHFPHFNSSLDLAARELILKQSVHIGVAVDTERGLLVPVLRDVGSKGLGQLASELNDITARTRNKKLLPDELEGATFTISNLGGIGGHAFTPLINPPQVAILGVSRADMQPHWNGHELVPELLLPLSLTYDHRVIDGADGARFLRWVCEAIENPFELIVQD